MGQLGPNPIRDYNLKGCLQITAPLTVPTPLSNITLDTGPPPFAVAVEDQRGTAEKFVHRNHAVPVA